MEGPNQLTPFKKPCKIVRMLFLVIRKGFKGISKTKLLLDLQFLMMKRGKMVQKAISNFMFHHHHHSNNSSAGNNQSLDPHRSFDIPPGEYEFSCSNSPDYQFPFSKKGKNHHSKSHSNDELTAVSAVQHVLKMLNNEISETASPVLPLYEESPVVRQVRITDSPFSLSDSDEDNHVDKEAEEFIKRFYDQLKLQGR